MEMRDYQLATLGFMVDQERLPGGIHSHFWAPVDRLAAVPEAMFAPPNPKPAAGAASSSSASSAAAVEPAEPKLWYSPILNQFRKKAPPVVCGGIVADEMVS